MRRVIVYKGENGYWVSECPTLPGCVSQGKTVELAMKNIQEAIQAYVEALKMDNLPVPPETTSLMVAEV
jgi:predicted RNase H-like HicB family nuclease